MLLHPPQPNFFPYTTLFQSGSEEIKSVPASNDPPVIELEGGANARLKIVPVGREETLVAVVSVNEATFQAESLNLLAQRMRLVEGKSAYHPVIAFSRGGFVIPAQAEIEAETGVCLPVGLKKQEP